MPPEITIPVLGISFSPFWFFLHPLVLGLLAVRYERSFWLWFWLGFFFVYSDIAFLMSIWAWKQGGWWDVYDRYLSPGAIWGTIKWVFRNAEQPPASPQAQAPTANQSPQERAGREAEERVGQVLRTHAESAQGCHRLMNNLLLVFNRGTSNQFSAELDHV